MDGHDKTLPGFKRIFIPGKYALAEGMTASVPPQAKTDPVPASAILQHNTPKQLAIFTGPFTLNSQTIKAIDTFVNSRKSVGIPGICCGKVII